MTLRIKIAAPERGAAGPPNRVLGADAVYLPGSPHCLVSVLRDQPRLGSVASCDDIFYSSHHLFYRPDVRRRNDLEGAAAFRAVPLMSDLPLVSILGLFGRDERVGALNALHSEARTTSGGCSLHGETPLLSRPRSERRLQKYGTRLRCDSLTIHLNVNRRKWNLSPLLRTQNGGSGSGFCTKPYPSKVTAEPICELESPAELA